MTRSHARPCRLMQAQSASAQPSRDAASLKAEACGEQVISSGRNQLCEFGANAVMERVPCRQNAYVLVSAGEDEPVGVGDGAGPDRGLGPDGRSQREVTRAAHHEVGAVESREGRRRQPGTAVLAEFRRSTAMTSGRSTSGARLVDKAHMRVLILGGTADAMVLGERLAEQAGIAVTFACRPDAAAKSGHCSHAYRWFRRSRRPESVAHRTTRPIA